MKLVSKALAVIAVVVLVTAVSHLADASLADRGFSYDTIPTDDVPDVHSGCGRFDADGEFRLDIDGDGFDGGSWREFRFRGISFFQSQFDAYGTEFNVTGLMAEEGKMVGSATFYDGQTKLVLWEAEDTGCDPIAP